MNNIYSRNVIDTTKEVVDTRTIINNVRNIDKGIRRDIIIIQIVIQFKKLTTTVKETCERVYIELFQRSKIWKVSEGLA